MTSQFFHIFTALWPQSCIGISAAAVYCSVQINGFSSSCQIEVFVVFDEISLNTTKTTSRHGELKPRPHATLWLRLFGQQSICLDVDMQRFSSSVSHINDLGATCILCRFADCLPRPEPLPDADYQPQTGTPFQTSRGELLFNRIISPSLTS